MGAGASKPADSSKQVFTSENPVQFSQDLIDSLQISSESNSTRAKSLDLHIQQRVAAELKRIQEEESSKFEAIRKKISLGDSDQDSTPKSKPIREAGLLDLPSVSVKDLLSTGESAEEKARKSQSSKKVQAEIDKLKKALGERKAVTDLPKEVEEARQGVISCLRLNDRQPLDCWKEVEVFKREVRKLEEQFVGKVL